MSTSTHSPPIQAISSRRQWIVLFVVIFAAVLDLLDSTITNVAAPTIARDLHGGEGLVQWLGAAYALALGIFLVAGGRLGDKFGRRRLFLFGAIGFTLASIACGLSFDPGSMVIARLIQGIFGSLLIPQGFGILGSVFPRDQLGKAFSAFGPVLGMSAVGGPILAGFLIDANILGLGWRAMFLINIVLGGAVILAAFRFLPKDTGNSAVVIDGLGSMLLSLAMLGVLFGLIEGSSQGWSAGPFMSLAGGIVFFGLFAQRQRVATNPLIKPSLLKNRGFTSGLILSVVFFAAVSGLLYVISLYLQSGLGFTPTRAAISLSPIALGIVVASVLSYRFIEKLGRNLVAISLSITLISAIWLLVVIVSNGNQTSMWMLLPPILLTGFGMGICFTTVYKVTLGDIDPSEAGSASGSLTAVQQLANAVGSAAVTTVYFHTSGDQNQAMNLSVVVVLGLILVSCFLVRLLPRKVQVL